MTHPLQSADALESGAVMQLVERLFDRWELDGQVRHALLSGDGEPHAVDQSGAPTTLERARRLLEIHAGLTLLFPDNPELRWTWVARSNRALNGMTPLDVMLEGYGGIRRVVQLIRNDTMK